MGPGARSCPGGGGCGQSPPSDATAASPGLHHPHQPGQTQPEPDHDPEGAHRVSHGPGTSGNACGGSEVPPRPRVSQTVIPLPGGSDGKIVCLQCWRPGFNPRVGKILWRRKRHPTPVLLPGKSRGWRNLVGYSPWGLKELDTTKRLHFHFSFLCQPCLPDIFFPDKVTPSDRAAGTTQPCWQQVCRASALEHPVQPCSSLGSHPLLLKPVPPGLPGEPGVGTSFPSPSAHPTTPRKVCGPQAGPSLP